MGCRRHGLRFDALLVELRFLQGSLRGGALPQDVLAGRGQGQRTGLFGAVFQEHVVLDGQTDARTHNVADRLALGEQGVNDRRARWHHGRLQQEAEEGEDRVHFLELFARDVLFQRHTLAELAEDDQVQDQRRGQQRVFARVVHGDRVLPTHEDLAGVLVHGTLAVPNVRDVLDHHGMVRVFVFLEHDPVRGHHVVDDVTLGDFFGAKLRRSTQVFPVVVPQVVVGDDADRFDPGADQEIHHDGLHLRLPTLEVVASNEDVEAFRQLDGAGHERVLRTAVDVGAVFQHGGDGKDGRRGDFRVAFLDGGQEVVGGVVDAFDDVREAFRVRGPQHDDFVQVVGRLEVANVGADLLHLLRHGTGFHVVRTVFLVGGNKILHVHGRHGRDFLHVRVQLALQVIVEDPRASHGVAQWHGRNVPATDDQVRRVQQRDHVFHRDEDVVPFPVDTELARACLGDAAQKVGLVLCFFRVPLQTEFVGQNAARHSGAVVAPEAHKQDTRLGDLGLRLKNIFGGLRADDHRFSILATDHLAAFVGVVGLDIVGAVNDFVGLDAERIAGVLVGHVAAAAAVEVETK